MVVAFDGPRGFHPPPCFAVSVFLGTDLLPQQRWISSTRFIRSSAGPIDRAKSVERYVFVAPVASAQLAQGEATVSGMGALVSLPMR